jgi:dihydrodipicolinate synthase/N-acetylneuraminate lyase
LRELVAVLQPQVDGVLLFGSNGEAAHLTHDERERGLAEVPVEKPLWVGAGDESTMQAERHVRIACDAGAVAALVTPPRYYANSLGPEGLLHYFQQLACLEAIPIWLYHIPQLTKSPIPLEVVSELASYPHIAGLKDSSGEMARMAYYQAQKLDLTVFTGHAPSLLAALALGANGAILAAANLAPVPYRSLVAAWSRGDVATARRWQKELEPLGRVLGRGGFVLLKQAMRYLGLPAGWPRPPYPHESPAWQDLEPILVRLREQGALVSG